MKYSVIVPVYNAAKHLDKCLVSLTSQSFNDFEIVIIDDGSTDNSLDISMAYKKKYKNISVFHQKNSGCVAAREYGVKKASGTYCLFVDADDWLEKNALETIESYICSFDDIDVLKYRFIYEPSGKQGKSYNVINRLLNEDELFELRKKLLLTSRYNNLCNQCFKRKLFDCIKISSQERVCYGEDIMINLDIIGKASEVVLINDTLYHYYNNPNSVTHSITINEIAKNINDNIQVNKKRIRYLKVYKIEDIDSEVIRSMSLVFACKQIKQYLMTSKRLDLAALKKSIEQSGLYNFVNSLVAPNLNWTDRIICSCILNKSYNVLYLMRPFARIKKFLRKE